MAVPPSPLRPPSSTPTSPPAEYVVTGTVLRRAPNAQADAPAAGVTVQVFHQDVASATLLKEGQTGLDGKYRITFTGAELLAADGAKLRAVQPPALRALIGTSTTVVNSGPDLWAGVPRKGGGFLVKSDIVFNAGAETQIDLVLPAGAAVSTDGSELERVSLLVLPKLKAAPLDGLTDEQAQFLSKDTGLPLAPISALILAAKLAKEAAPPSTRTAAGPSASEPPDDLLVPFYGLLRTRREQALANILGIGPDLWRRALQTAFDKAILPKSLASSLDGWLSKLSDLRISRTLQPASADASTRSLGDLLDALPTAAAIGDASKRTALAGLWTATAKPDDSFWTKVAALGLSDLQVAALKTTVALGNLAGGNIVLLKALQARTPKAPDGTLAHLAALDGSQWFAIAAEAAAKEDTLATIGDAATKLQLQIESQFPSASFKAGLDNGALKLDAYPAKNVSDFLAKYPAFDLAATDIEPFLQEQKLDDASLKAALLGPQRWLRAGASHAEAAFLWNAGLQAPHKLVARGPGFATSALSGVIPAPRLAQLSDKAHAVVADMIGMASAVTARFNPNVAGLGGMPTSPDVLKRFPSLAALFGDQSYCSCRHCNSVHGPAAYLVDRLRTLSHSGVEGELKARRPDIRRLELTCENANTEMLYADLVLEVLESAAWFPKTITLTTAEMAQLDGGTVPPTLLTALAATVETLDGSVTVDFDPPSSTPGAPRGLTLANGTRRWIAERQHKSMTVSGIFPTGHAGATAIVPDASIDAIVQALQQGRVDPALQALVCPEARLPVMGTPTVTALAPAGSKWTVAFERAVYIVFDVSASPNKTEFLAADLSVIESVAVPWPTSLMESGLNQGIVPFPIPLLLPPLSYKAAHSGSTFTPRWIVTTTQTVTVTYAPDTLTLTGMAYVASKAKTDLTVFPANRNPKAYALLADASSTVFPWTLPFDAFTEEARACLAALGVPRGRLMRTLRPKLARLSLEDACESLATSLEQLKIVAEPEPDDTRGALLWGLRVSGNALTDPSGDPDAAAIPADWVGALSRLSVLIERSRVPVTTMSAALFHTLYLQGAGSVPGLWPQFECRPSQITVKGLTGKHLKRLHRFLRLRLITGWSIRDLDAALWAVSDGGTVDIGQPQIVALANIQELSRRFGLPIGQVAAWVGPMETHAYTDVEAHGSPVLPSLYEEVYLAARPGRSPDLDFALNATATELQYLAPGTTPKKLTDKLQQLSAALSVDPTGLAALITGQAPLLQDQLTLAMLTRLFSYVSQAKVFGLSAAEWAFAFSQADQPTGPGASTPTVDQRSVRILHFADVIHDVKASGFSFDELAQCLDQPSTDPQAEAARQSDRLQWLTQLQTSLRAVQDVANIDVTEAALRSAFGAAGWSTACIDRVMGDGDGQPLGLATTRLVVTLDAATQPPALPAGLPFALTAEPSGKFSLSLGIDDFAGLADTETPFANLVLAVPTLGPLTAPTKPATILRSQWRNQSTAIGVISKWLQSIEQPSFSHALDFSIAAPPGLTGTLMLPGSLAGVIDTSTAGSLVIHGFLSTGQAAALKAAAGASNASTFGQAVDSLIGPPLALSDAESRLQYDPQGASLKLLGYLDASEKTETAALSVRSEFAAAVQALGAAADAFVEHRAGQQLMTAAEVQSLYSQRLSPADRYARVYAAMVRPLRRALVAGLASARMGIDPRLFAALDSQAQLATPARDVLAPLCSADFVNDVIDTDSPPADALTAAAIIDRVGLMARRLKPALPEAAWFDPTNGFLGLAACSFTALSAAAAKPAERFRAWRRTIALFAERSATPQQSAGIEQIRTATGKTLDTAIDAISALFMLPTGSKDAVKLDGEIAQASDLLDPLKLRKVLHAARTIRRSSSAGSVLVGLCAGAPTDPDCVAARGALYAKYGAEIGAAGLREAINRLRDKERAALVEYLIQRNGLTDSADLHAYYLLDVEMGPEMLTSRLVQAISSTQLFFQRWIMNLEPASLPAPSADIAQQWEWASDYRVWEANRKIFLYPEDWLEPSLRDDKSDLFRKFETGLLQGEPSTDTALQLLQDYLVGLQQLSRLSIRAMYTERTDSFGEAVVHMVARTVDSPAQFYYRQWRIMPFSPNVSRSSTPWEPLSSVSDTEHIVCFMRNGRPCVGWLQLNHGQDLTKTPAGNSASPAPGPGSWTIELQWSRRGNDGWSAPQKWAAPIWPALINKDAAASFALRVEDNSGSPRLCLYGAQDKDDPAVFVAPFQLGEGTAESTSPPPGAGVASTTVQIQVTGAYDTGGDEGVLYIALDEARVEIWGDWYLYEQILDNGSYKGWTAPDPGSDIAPWPTADNPMVLTVSNGIAQAALDVPIFGYKVDQKRARFFVRVTVVGLTPYTSPEIDVDPTQNNQIQLGVQFPVGPDEPRLSPDRPVRLIQLAAVDWNNSLGAAGGGPGDGTELWRPDWTIHRSSGFYMSSKTHSSWPPNPFDPGDPTFPFRWAGVDLTNKLVSWFAAGSAGFGRGDIDWPLYLEVNGSGALFAPTKSGWVMMPAQELAWPTALAAVDVSSATSLSLGRQDLVDELARLETAIQPAPAPGVTRLQSTDTEFALPMFDSGYDWEIHFHIPIMVAKVLATNQRYADALRWLHLILDPTASLPAEKRRLLPLFGAPLPSYWKFRPFAEAGQGINIDTLLTDYTAHTLDLNNLNLLNSQIAHWKRQPFQPYGIARMRIRAFQWRTLFDYLDVLIGRADQLYKQDTIRSINQATQLYLLAWELLGRRPTAMPEQPPPDGPATFARYEARWDDFANAWVSLGDTLPNSYFQGVAHAL